MVIVKMSGGLGNQMFEYAFAKWLQMNGREVKLDIEQYGVKQKGLVNTIHNGFELERFFKIDIPYAERKEIEKYGDIQQDIIHKVLRKLRKKKTHIKRSEFLENKWFFPQTAKMDHVYFDGYWCTFEYANAIEEIIRSIYRFDQPLTGKNAEIAEIIQNRESVSIHIRRGDYLKLQDMYVILDENYYRRAMKTMEERVKDPIYICFSDDIEWCRKQLQADHILFVDWNQKEDSYLDLLLMSQCKHNILANSTFSMWAAWLNSNHGRNVIRPQRIFVDDIHMASDMFPDDWYVLSN